MSESPTDRVENIISEVCSARIDGCKGTRMTIDSKAYMVSYLL